MEQTLNLFLYITFLSVQYYCCSMVAHARSPSIATDQSALIALKAHIQTDPNNTLVKNWTVTTSVCKWVGVTCGIRHQRVRVLDLSYMGLVGTIPPHIGNLSFLVQLYFQNNSFYGSLPVELSRLRRLQLLNLGFNNFKGEIPSWMGSLPKLQILYLYYNQFSGSIPATIFNLSSIQVLHLSPNRLSGSIPREIGNSTTLKELYLNQNYLEEIPEEIANTQLERLHVEENALKGPIPQSLFNMSSLYSLALTNNSLSGILPDDLCQHLPVIQEIFLSFNHLQGPIPAKLSHCKRLFILSLSFNHFTGHIPKTVGNLTQLRHIYLGDNNLTGPIPKEIGDLQKLKVLSLLQNKHDGLIPYTIFNISTLNVVQLGFNQLSGSLPPEIGLWAPNLEQLFVSSNGLKGAFPKTISNASKLKYLDMGGNSFSGYIPKGLGNLRNLKVLNILGSNLSLDGKSSEANILEHLHNMKDLQRLTLSPNPLDTTLPNSIGNWSSSLQYLILGGCKLRGKVPDGIGNLSSLVSLVLSQNLLTGSIPPSIARLRNLQGLYLYENKFQGQIPNELCKMEGLAELYLDANELYGSIPMCFADVASLRSLSLASNALTSSIPSNLWGLVDILFLNLSSNSLEGSLPVDVGNLKVVSVLDFSHNQLSKNIPTSIGQLQALEELHLSHNHFEGSIPDSFGNLLNMKFLDLSNNNLSGAIPKSLERMLQLRHLNLSSNMLEGDIPTGGPFKTFNAQTFMSNKALCGASRLKVPRCKSPSSRSQKAKTILLKYILPILLSILLILGFLIWLVLWRKRRNIKQSSEGGVVFPQTWQRVSYQELSRATNEFNAGNLLGSGAFGSVYKGTLANGMDVAVKVFNLQLEGAFKMFDVECEILHNVRHRNLVKIFSSCSNQIDFKALVLDYMPHGSLEKLLYSNELCLNFLQRLNIMIDVALALVYLHYEFSTAIIHCDLKPSNVLLDDDMVAHVADFGIARLLNGDDSMTQTITLATIGYMAPEYGFEGVVSKRGDVYSYGILLIETFTKRKPTDEMFDGEMSLRQWVKNSFPDEIAEVIDVDLLRAEEENDIILNNCVSSVLELALLCAVESPEERINMKNVVNKLKKIKMEYIK